MSKALSNIYLEYIFNFLNLFDNLIFCDKLYSSFKYTTILAAKVQKLRPVWLKRAESPEAPSPGEHPG